MAKPDPGDDSFHYFDGTNKIKFSVARKLKQLSRVESGWKDVVDIVEKMIEVNPEERLTAAQLVDRLQMVGA